jgi:hypothetical protein
MLRAALQLAERGMHVFPCRVGGKEPATPHGLLDASTDPIVIQQWWQTSPQFNIGVRTGQPSNLIVLDVDGIDAEAELRKLEAVHGALPETVEVLTARGRHVWFRHPGHSVKNSAGKIAPGIDSRGDNGYVLVPPSLHPSGRRYCWSVDCAGTIAPAPGWLLAEVTERKNGNGALPSSEWRELVQAIVAEGSRDCTITKLVGHLLRRRIDAVVVLALMQSWNATNCAPPLAEKDVERIVASIAGIELRRRRQGDG